MSNSFYIPAKFDRFSQNVYSRFNKLIEKRIISGVVKMNLMNWWSNFSSDEERYLAAHLLDSLVLRTKEMLDSSSLHLVEMVLPNILYRLDKFNANDLPDFLQKLQTGSLDVGIKFVAVDGEFENTPGKSGSVLIRNFRLATRIDDSLTIRPENIANLSSDSSILVFLDDCLGTGKQFNRFCKHYNLQSYSHTLIYIPFIAHPKGIEHLKTKQPDLIVSPIEILPQNSNFFMGHKADQNIWHRDGFNHIDSVKKLYKSILERHSAYSSPS